MAHSLRFFEASLELSPKEASAIAGKAIGVMASVSRAITPSVLRGLEFALSMQTTHATLSETRRNSEVLPLENSVSLSL